MILASRSPRRRVLLERLGLDFSVHPSAAEEVWPAGEIPEKAVCSLAEQKASSVASDFPDALTVGADTVVVLKGEVLGKPRSRADARSMLTRLSGQTHTVLTGIALVHPASGRSVAEFEMTRVRFALLTAQQIDAYVATGSPLDKAGAYGIQDDHGALLISGITGDYYNVVGLPLHRLYQLLISRFADLMVTA